MQRDVMPPHLSPGAPSTGPAALPRAEPMRDAGPPPTASFDQAEAGEGDVRLAYPANPAAAPDADSTDVITPAPALDDGEAGAGDMRLGGTPDATLGNDDDDAARRPPRPGTVLTLLIGGMALAASGVAPGVPATLSADPPEPIASQMSTTAARGFAPPAAAFAATRPAAGGAIDFVKDVKPLLESRCVQCHGPEKASNEYRMDTRALAFKGGEKSDQTSTDPIVPGDARGSLIYQFISTQNPDRKMPPKGKAEPFTPAQIELLRKWIDGGANWPEKVELKAPAVKK